MMYGYLSRVSPGGYAPSPRESSLRYVALEGKMARLEARLRKLEEAYANTTEYPDAGDWRQMEFPLKSAEEADRGIHRSRSMEPPPGSVIEQILDAWMNPRKYMGPR